MQFITTGNRIAVENFVLGDLYTITFTNGTYINSACIGIGDNFVTFQRNEPELLFSLTMATAELVSSIDLYAGGTGTNNYNDLNNKPQINDFELVGNKSLSDLGIQPIISDLDTIRAGAAAGATSVQPDALSDYQPLISDLDTIRSGAAAGATAVQPAALADYQPIIDSSNKLDADLVDDTTATHKFATAAQLSQIETNKNNILLLEQANGAKNVLNISTIEKSSNIATTLNSDKTITLSVTSANARSYVYINGNSYIQNVYSNYILVWDNGGNQAINCGVTYSNNGTSWANESFNNTGSSIEINSNYSYLRFSMYFEANTAITNATVKIMLIPKSAYNAGFTDYQPYAMSNAELTAAIQALQAQLNQ